MFFIDSMTHPDEKTSSQMGKKKEKRKSLKRCDEENRKHSEGRQIGKDSKRIRLHALWSQWLWVALQKVMWTASYLKSYWKCFKSPWRKCSWKGEKMHSERTQQKEERLLLLLRGVWLPASLHHSSFPSPDFLISLSDFEMLIWMSGSSLKLKSSLFPVLAIAT